MSFRHEESGPIHPWVLRDGGLPLQPFPPLVPGFVLNPDMLETNKVTREVPHGAVHNGFVPPAQRVAQHIIQPDRWHGNKSGKRQ